MLTLDEWVEQNCTGLEKQVYSESLLRQKAIFDAMIEAGEARLENNKLVFTELHKDHADDAVWESYEARYLTATGQEKK